MIPAIVGGPSEVPPNAVRLLSVFRNDGGFGQVGENVFVVESKFSEQMR
jgi:hypothetical protein